MALPQAPNNSLYPHRIEDNKPASVRMAASLFRQICYTNKNMLTAGIIVAGCDDDEGPAVYSIPLGGSVHRQKLALGGSGSQFIYGYCDSNFTEKMPRDKAIEFAKNGNYIYINRHFLIVLREVLKFIISHSFPFLNILLSCFPRYVKRQFFGGCYSSRYHYCLWCRKDSCSW